MTKKLPTLLSTIIIIIAGIAGTIAARDLRQQPSVQQPTKQDSKTPSTISQQSPNDLANTPNTKIIQPTRDATTVQPKYSILALPEENITFPLPQELTPIAWMISKDDQVKNTDPSKSAYIELNGGKYKETSLIVQQRPEEKYSKDIPISIKLLSYTPKLMPDYYFEDNYCEQPGTRIQEKIEKIDITVVKQKCNGDNQYAYGYWFDIGSRTFGIMAPIEGATDQLKYFEDFLTEFISLNQSQ